MEESKELQGFYKIFRAVIYISVLLEFFEYAIDPSPMGSIVCELHDRIKQWMIYHDGNMVYSKVATFLLDRATQKLFYPYFKHRGIDLYTQYAFHKHFVLAAKQRSDGLSFANLAFPLTKPNEEKVIGLEERGRPRMDGSGGYKGKAEGSNSAEGLWIANLTGKPLSQAKEILWFESAYDAMAEYQINPAKSVFVSTGGTPTTGQIRGMLEVTPNARHYLGFDKDEAGRQFVENFKAIAKELGFRQENVQAYHPSGIYKDWNDALLNKKSPSLLEQGYEDCFDCGEFLAEKKIEKEEHKGIKR